MLLVSSRSCLRSIHWSQLLSWEWRCNWSSADRRCSNYIWVINNFIAYWGATYIRGFTVIFMLFSFLIPDFDECTSSPCGMGSCYNLPNMYTCTCEAGFTGYDCDSGNHHNDVIMGAIAPQITNLTIVYSTVYSDADQRKHQSSASLAFVRGIHRGPVNFPHKWPVTPKWCFHSMTSSWCIHYACHNSLDPGNGAVILN